MYQYSEFDRNFVNQRVAHYRDQTQRYLDGKLSDDEFLQLRLRNGLYIQRLAPMLRVAVPYGTLSSKQLRALATIARDYDRGYGHLSTRQNMQFNWPALEDVPDILQALADVDMHAIQTSGSCIRNVTTDQFAGPRLTNTSILGPFASFCASGLLPILNSSGFRASSKSQSPVPAKIAPQSGCTTSACKSTAPTPIWKTP